LKKIIFILNILITLSSYSQVTEEYNTSCDWYLEILKVRDPANRLKIVQENFREYDHFDKNDSCKIVFILTVKERIFILSKDSSIWYAYLKLMINEAKVEDIDTILILNKKATEALYGKNINGAVFIQSSSTDYEKRIDSIWNSKM